MNDLVGLMSSMDGNAGRQDGIILCYTSSTGYAGDDRVGSPAAERGENMRRYDV